MPLTTAGAQFIAKAVTGLNTPVLLNSTWYHIGVGNNPGDVAFNVGQTDLVAATGGGQFLRVQVASVAESGGVITAVATFGTTQANWEWKEWGSFNNSSGGTMYQRKVESPSLGTKTSAQVWQLTATLTHSAS